MTGGKMNQLPAPASRLWEAGIRKLNSTMAIRRGGGIGAAAVPGSIDLLPTTAIPASSAATTIYAGGLYDSDEATAAGADAAASDESDSEDSGSGSDADTSPDISHSEQLLPSGDFYQGGVVVHGSGAAIPHGTGKFLWTDGSMYEGSWRHGRASGRGKFSWPSGATYEGDLAGGYMHGHGTYIGEFGDTFAGHWAGNFRHGRGTQAYANGDVYDGLWRDGRPDGHGRYIWRYGHEYVGAWKAGEMSGLGTVIWADGDRYDGAWEDARPKGQGTFRWADGGMYIGVWWGNNTSTSSEEAAGDGEEEGKSGGGGMGVYYPPSGGPAVAAPPREAREAICRLVEELEVTEGKEASLLPSQKILTWPGVEALVKKPVWKPPEPEELAAQARRAADRRSSVSDLDVSGLSEQAPGSDAAEHQQQPEPGELVAHSVAAVVEKAWMRAPTCMRAPPRPAKKQGETISKGHKNYELMLNLQLGIRHAVGRHSAPNSLDLKSSAFDPKEKVWSRFPPEGSKHTPPHQSCDFRWKDYCPLVFRTLRKLFDVDPADYMISICGDDALRELSSPGKSGSFFYLTNDDKYMIKTMKKSEVKVLLRMLPAYYKHVRSFDNTLVTKFFGLHCVKITGAIQKKVRFVIMGNLFCSHYAIHRRFDLKGSSQGRMTDKPIDQIDEHTTLKDLDLNFIFRLGGSRFQDFCRQVDRDCELLEQERIMDYSLLVGIHFKDRYSNVDNGADEPEPLRKPPKLGIAMPSRVENVVRTSPAEGSSECAPGTLIGEPTGEFKEVILFFGIIDILQDYDISKKLEHAYKSQLYDPNSISAVDPKQYCKRFRDFIYRAFTQDVQ